MSRAYEISVEISGYRPYRSESIREAAIQEWAFSEWYESGGTLSASAEGSLGGGESEEDFTERLSLAIWQANEAYCDVTVNATYLESLPYETHTLDEADYERLIHEQQEQQDAHGPGR